MNNTEAFSAGAVSPENPGASPADFFAKKRITHPPPLTYYVENPKERRVNDMNGFFGGSFTWIIILLVILVLLQDNDNDCCCHGNMGNMGDNDSICGCGCGCFNR